MRCNKQNGSRGTSNQGRGYFPACGRILHEHIPYLFVFGVYLGTGILLENKLGRDFFSQSMWRYLVLAVFAGIYFSFQLTHRIFIKMSRILALPIERVTGKTRVNRDPIAQDSFTFERFCGFIIVFTTMPIFLSVFSNIKQAIPLLRPFDWDNMFMRIDLIIHGGYHPWTILQSILGYPRVTKVIDYLYVSWFPVLFFSIVSFGWSMRRKLRAQFFLSFMLVWILAGTILAILFFSAGPCYYGWVTGSENPFQPLMKYLDSVHGTNFLFAVKFQRGLWGAYQHSEILPFGGISAMPSVHVATAVIIALAGLRVNRLLGILLVAYAAMIQIGSVHLGWHYAIDGYFSSVLAVLIWGITGRAVNRYSWMHESDQH